jgi:hypothetical protein
LPRRSAHLGGQPAHHRTQTTLMTKHAAILCLAAVAVAV